MTMIGKDWRDVVRQREKEIREEAIASLVDKPMIVSVPSPEVMERCKKELDAFEAWKATSIPSDVEIRQSPCDEKPKVGTHFYIPGEFAKKTEPGEWKFEWVKYPVDNRFQIVNIPRRDLLDIITGKARITNIPDGATIDAIDYDFIRDAICLRVSHPSFEVVADGSPAKNFCVYFEQLQTRESGK